MAKARNSYRPLYIGEWIAILKRNQADVADAIGVGRPYLNSLISGGRKNPSGALLLDISEELKITVNDLYRKPPKATSVEDLQQLSPQAIGLLVKAQQ
jgi:transcriptional regulator with XRE-family HTH domain